MLVCRVAVGNMLETKVAMQTDLPKGFHSVHAVPSDGGLKYPEYVIYNQNQVKYTRIYIKNNFRAILKYKIDIHF
jgi:hypothetical protein